MTRGEMIVAMEKMKRRLTELEDELDSLRSRVYGLESKQRWAKTKAIGRYGTAYDHN